MRSSSASVTWPPCARGDGDTLAGVGDENARWTPEFTHSAEAAARRTSFGAWAGEYSKFRPSYPPEVIEHLLSGLPDPATIADIGAGTGHSLALWRQPEPR